MNTEPLRYVAAIVIGGKGNKITPTGAVVPENTDSRWLSVRVLLTKTFVCCTSRSIRYLQAITAPLLSMCLLMLTAKTLSSERLCVVSGMNANHCAADASCIRAQIMTFLWRLHTDK